MVSLAMSGYQMAMQALTRGAIQEPTELASLIELLQERKPHHILEIGSEAGGTFWAWCQIATGLKISIDKPDGNSGSGRFVDPDALALRTAGFQSYAKDVRVITGDSHSPLIVGRVRSILRGELLDFMFIDGDHAYEGVKKDFDAYREMVKRGGLIAFHDIKDSEHHRYRGCFVSDFWKELEGPKKEFLAPSDWGGIGVIEN